VKEQPGWTNVTEGSRLGEKQGWCKVNDSEDANSFYGTQLFIAHQSTSLILIEPDLFKRKIVVHVFATSARTGQFEMIRCNCGHHFHNVGARGHSPGRSGIDAYRFNRAFGNRSTAPTAWYAASVQQKYPARYCYQAPASVAVPAYTSVCAYPTHPMQPVTPQMPVYSHV
jgi:hypothetical protein